MFGAVHLYRQANTHPPVLFVPAGVTRLLLSIDPERKPGHICLIWPFFLYGGNGELVSIFPRQTEDSPMSWQPLLENDGFVVDCDVVPRNELPHDTSHHLSGGTHQIGDFLVRQLVFDSEFSTTARCHGL